MATLTERILLIGDRDRRMQAALAQAMPAAQVTSVGSYFDGIAELSGNTFTSVLAAAEPIERRPEAAVRALRQLAGDGRVLLFGNPSLEPVSRKMLSFGCDDYLITPASPQELQQVFGTPPLRLAPEPGTEAGAHDAPEPLVTAPPSKISLLAGLPLAEILLDALVQHPGDTAANAVKRINARIGPMMRLHYVPRKNGAGAAPPPPAGEGLTALRQVVRSGSEEPADLCLLLPRDEEEAAARHFLSQLAHLVGKVAALEDRHAKLQKLAITDDLTGVYNGRYFRHFLTRVLDRARTLRFPVSLLLFDIDNFKQYNEQFGHGVGDAILKQTARLMRECVREHDLVARLSAGGDEFAVVFWEKEGPRVPKDGKPAGPPGKPPQTPMEVLDRFRARLASPEFSVIGPMGQGKLTISGGLSVFPYDAQTVDGLIEAADKALMFGAKQAGKNSIVLVGRNGTTHPPTEE